jgi:hypothetical protein
MNRPVQSSLFVQFRRPLLGAVAVERAMEPFASHPRWQPNWYAREDAIRQRPFDLVALLQAKPIPPEVPDDVVMSSHGVFFGKKEQKAYEAQLQFHSLPFLVLTLHETPSEDTTSEWLKKLDEVLDAAPARFATYYRHIGEPRSGDYHAAGKISPRSVVSFGPSTVGLRMYFSCP